MKLPLEFNSKWDSTLRVEVLENRPASIGFTENGDNIVLNLWGSILGEKKNKKQMQVMWALLQKSVHYLQVDGNFCFLS